jgi:hypothetical protein
MKIRPVGAELFYLDGRTDMKKLIVAFRNFANAPKKKLTNDVLYPLLNDRTYGRSKLFFTERHVSPSDCTTNERYVHLSTLRLKLVRFNHS